MSSEVVVDTIMSNLKFKVIIFGLILTFILVSSAAMLYIDGTFTNNLETRTYSDNLGGEPIQTSYSGKTFSIDDTLETYTITPVAKYEITAKVVSIADYNHDKFGISPLDLCMVWGKVANDNNIIYSQGGRLCSFRYTGTLSVSDNDAISHFSNNHIIPSNDTIAKALKSIKTNDVVTIKGYLVDVTKTYIVGNGKWMWKTSQSRYDTRDGSCEIIYVTSVS